MSGTYRDHILSKVDKQLAYRDYVLTYESQAFLTGDLKELNKSTYISMFPKHHYTAYISKCTVHALTCDVNISTM